MKQTGHSPVKAKQQLSFFIAYGAADELVLSKLEQHRAEQMHKRVFQ